MNLPELRMVRLTIKDFRGIIALDEVIAPGGAVIKGANARGKTSALRALAAALSAEDVGPDAIRIGAARAEIYVDLEALRVRRLITPKGNSVKVTAPDGTEFAKPQTLLNELLGGGIDPLAFAAADPKEQRRIILQAIPTRVTAEQVQRWTAGRAFYSAEGFDLEKTPGLEVVSRLRQGAYDQRTKAKKDAKETLDTATRAAAALPAIPDAPPIEEAEEARAAADRALEALQVRAARAEGALAALEGNLSRAGEKRARAAERVAHLPGAPTEDEQQALADRWDAANAEVAELRLKLRDAEERADACHKQVKAWDAEAETRRIAQEEAARLIAEAEELERPAAAAVEAPAPEVLAAARVELDRARANVEAARAADKARAQHEAAAGLRATADVAAAEAAALEAIVKTLTEDAPKELAAAGDAIRGLTFEGEGIALDGVLLDKLSGAEQLLLSVEIAKRVAGKVRILVVDTLERLDSEMRERFLRKATEGGWQVLCACVADGDPVFEAISLADDAAEGRAA
jgi:hypothetical protein